MADATSTRRIDQKADDAARWDPPATLPGRDYCSDEVFEVERDRLFQGSWFCVGRAEELPETGSFVVADVAGESVLIVRGADGSLRAFLNVCRHRGSQLCQGSGSVSAIRCPYHAWSYGLDGRLLATPNVSRGERLSRERLGLHEVRLDVWEGFVWVSIAGDGGGLTDHLTAWASDDPFQWNRYGVGDLVIGSRREYRVAANWKILIENYNECLHCPTVHPELVAVVPAYRKGSIWEPGRDDGGVTLADGRTSVALDPRLRLRHRHARDHADHPRGRRIGGDDPTDGDPGAAGVTGYVLVETDAGARAGHRHDDTECVAPHGLHSHKLQSRAGPLPAGAASYYATAIVKVASAGLVWHETHI